MNETTPMKLLMRHWRWMAGIVAVCLMFVTCLAAQAQVSSSGGNARDADDLAVRHDAAGQLTKEAARASGEAVARNEWECAEAGKWRNAGPTSRWGYDADNELLGMTSEGVSCGTVMVRGQVEPGVCSTKWADSTAEFCGEQG